jgi:NhaP-type Na+/H+ or K+/H+ antiporter
LARTGDGLIALSATFVAYGLTEILHVYGFLAVFVAALTLRAAHRDHEFHDDLHAMTEQVERLAMMVLLILFGGALVSGLLDSVTWTDAAIAMVILLVVRPLTGWIGLLGWSGDRGEKLTLSFFGIRGVGSIYYLAYGANHMALADVQHLWGILGLIVLLSILLHGLTVTPIMRSLDERRGVDPEAKSVPPPGLQGPAS